MGRVGSGQKMTQGDGVLSASFFLWCVLSYSPLRSLREVFGRRASRGVGSVFLHVVEDILHVFVVLKLLEEFLEGGTLLLGDLLEIVGYALKL